MIVRRSNPMWSWLSAGAGLVLWLANAYQLVTGLREMTLTDAICAGMIFFFGPMLIWEALTSVKRPA